MEDILKIELLKNILKAKGAKFEKQGGNHEKWRSQKGSLIKIPRHPNIKEITAKQIIKQADS